MSILVIAEPDAAFERWYEHQLEPAEPASDALRAKGQSLFQTKSCVLCHAVRGTEAGGKVAPDLTHLASRQTIAAGTLPMRRGALQGWIADPQTVKPGAHMPMTALSPDELVALGAYLAGLK
jgi:cytochrome c oxidase subunit 2